MIPRMNSGRVFLMMISNGYRCFDRRMRLVITDLEIFELVIKNGGRFSSQEQRRQRIGLARKLEVDLFDVVAVNMNITTGPYKITNLEVALLGDHMNQ